MISKLSLKKVINANVAKLKEMHQDFTAGAAGAQSDLGFISLRNLLFCSCSSIIVRFSMVKYILQAGQFPSAVQLINFYVY